VHGVTLKVLVSTPVNSVTGYGNDGIELIQALVRWGADVYTVPASVFPPVPREVAAVFTKPIPSHVDLLISHKCPQELAHPDRCGIFSVATVALAWTMWEWDSIANVDTISDLNCEHAFRVTDNLRDSLARFDATLAYDEVSKSALDPFHDNIHVLQGGVTPLDYMARDWFSNPFRFIMCGVLSARKNPFAAINAFKKLRDAGELEHATLTLKSTYPGLHPRMEKWCPGLHLIHDLWPIEQVHEFFGQSHVMVAPSWGEGKNRPAIEFATSGGAVVAPMIGGHAQWMSSEYTWPVRYNLKDFGSGSHGADVDVDHLAEIMLELYTDRASTRLRAERAAQCLPAQVAWPSVLERLMFRLPAIAGGRGSEVSALMRACRRAPASEGVHLASARSALDPV
jgi:glycosyltransferase involved in cell wall biosynthesis